MQTQNDDNQIKVINQDEQDEHGKNDPCGHSTDGYVPDGKLPVVDICPFECTPRYLQVCSEKELVLPYCANLATDQKEMENMDNGALLTSIDLTRFSSHQ